MGITINQREMLVVGFSCLASNFRGFRFQFRTENCTKNRSIFLDVNKMLRIKKTVNCCKYVSPNAVLHSGLKVETSLYYIEKTVLV